MDECKRRIKDCLQQLKIGCHMTAEPGSRQFVQSKMLLKEGFTTFFQMSTPKSNIQEKMYPSTLGCEIKYCAKTDFKFLILTKNILRDCKTIIFCLLCLITDHKGIGNIGP